MAVDGFQHSEAVHELNLSQEEADTRVVVLHCLYESQRSEQNRLLIIQSLDTDVLVLLTYFLAKIRPTILFDTGIGNKRTLINVSQIVANIGNNVAKALVGFHAFTGCDCTSAFLQKGKKVLYNLVKNSAAFQAMFAAMGGTADHLPRGV